MKRTLQLRGLAAHLGDNCKDDILKDFAPDKASQRHERLQASKVIREQRHVGRLNSHGRACTSDPSC